MRNEFFNEVIILLTMDGFFLFNHADVDLNYKLGYAVISIISILLLYTFSQMFQATYHALKMQMKEKYAV
jgi:hypothetical protein